MVRIHEAALAQKQAQQLWTVCAEMQRWDWLSRIRFLPVNASQDQAAPPLYDLIYWWIPYGDGEQPVRLAEGMKEMARTLRGGGNAFVVGPAQLARHGSSTGLHVCWEEPVEHLPTFRMHRTILPKAKLRAGLTLFHLKKV